MVNFAEICPEGVMMVGAQWATDEQIGNEGKRERSFVFIARERAPMTDKSGNCFFVTIALGVFFALAGWA